MDRIEFQCEKCHAVLKVRVAVAGRTVQCPRCAKKTKVPSLDEANPPEPEPVVEAPVPAEAAPAQPAPAVEAPISAEVAPAETAPALVSVEEPAAAPEPPPLSVTVPPAVVPEPPPVDTTAYTKRIAALEEALVVATTQAEASAESLRAAEAEALTVEALASLDADALQEEVAVRYEAELKAAHLTITELQGKLSAAYQSRIADAAPVQSPDPAAADDRDLVDPDVLLTELHAVTFGKYLRMAVVLHVAVILLTSVGMLMHLIHPPATEEATEPDGGAITTPAETPSPSDEVSEVQEDAQPEAAQRRAEPVARPKSQLEKQLEALPAPGESAPKSNVSLEGDL